MVTSAGTMAYTENGTTALDAGLVVADADGGNLRLATVTMTTNYVNGEDTLAFVTQNGISGSWSAATGVLALSGSSTVANYQTALRSITYYNNSDNPATATRTVTFVANDGGLNSNTATRTIAVTTLNDAPVLAATGDSLAYTGKRRHDGARFRHHGQRCRQRKSGLGDGDHHHELCQWSGCPLVRHPERDHQHLDGRHWDPRSCRARRPSPTTRPRCARSNTSAAATTRATTPRTVTFVANDGTATSLTVNRAIAVTAVNDAPSTPSPAVKPSRRTVRR